MVRSVAVIRHSIVSIRPAAFFPMTTLERSPCAESVHSRPVCEPVTLPSDCSGRVVMVPPDMRCTSLTSVASDQEAGSGSKGNPATLSAETGGSAGSVYRGRAEDFG